MTKEELIVLLENMNIEEIKNITIEYYTEKKIWYVDNRKSIILKIGEEND